jgi:gamma-glutamylcyclotransferase (GGCT)/AIG2-like uncharacterized protein YtfP
MGMNSQLLFVYGSMTEGMVHFDKIKDFIVSSTPAVANGSIFRLKIGIPAMALSGSDLIRGHLVELKTSEVLWHLLDSFFGFNQQDHEKSLYLREATNVLANDKLMTAWVYVLPKDKIPANAQLIPGGDWQSSLKDQPPMFEKLNEKQKNYILKLGASSGREIIPIDMVLYRELMGLELIVDKGRRLALSRLGQELYRALK